MPAAPVPMCHMGPPKGGAALLQRAGVEMRELSAACVGTDVGRVSGGQF